MPPPASMALRGMSKYLAEASASAKEMPDSALIDCKPTVPSEPVPESTTPMARLPCSSAREVKK